MKIRTALHIITTVFFLPAAALVTHILPIAANAQDRVYPAKPVRIITSVVTGSSGDAFARALGDALTRQLNQSIIIDPRPGVGGNLAAETVVRAAPDGYTLLMGSVASLSIATSYYKSLNYDLRRDLAPVSNVGQIANGLFVGPAIGANNLREFSAMIKTAPGKFSCASATVGGLLHLTCEMYKKAAGLDILHVPYRGTSFFMPDLMVGRVTMAFDTIPIYVPLVKAGKLKILAVTTSIRSPVLPEVPTMAEGGVTGVESKGLYGLFVPAGTPADIVQLLSREVANGLNEPVLRPKLLQQGIEAEPTTPEGLIEIIRSEIAKWAQVIKASDIKPE